MTIASSTQGDVATNLPIEVCQGQSRSSWWYVPHYVRKHAIIRRVLPAPLRLLVECGRRAKQLFGSKG